MSSSASMSIPSPGIVDVHDNEAFYDLVNDDHSHTRGLSSMTYDGWQLQSEPGSNMPSGLPRNASNMDSDALVGHSLKLQDWLNEKSIRSVQEKADLEAKKTRKMYSDVLDTENTFVKQLDNMLYYKDMLSLRKRQLLHKKWTKRVYEPIRREIDGQMKSPRANYPELCSRKRQLHKEYLEHVNRKGHVFLDTYAPDEYYPLGLHAVRPAPLVAKTGPLRDPLSDQARQRNDEDRDILRCETGSTLADHDLSQIRLPPLPLVPQGRHGTECSGWLGMPMGDIESPIRMASRRRMKGVYNNTKIDFQAWTKPPTTANSLHEEEIQTQKKRSYKLPPPRSAYAIEPSTSFAPSLPRDISMSAPPMPTTHGDFGRVIINTKSS